jgi:3-deoxy-D-manno-octulosonic acid (KDO) 8-phosphate synthase
VKNIQIKGLTIGNSNDFVLIAGLNVLQSDSVNQTCNQTQNHWNFL